MPNPAEQLEGMKLEDGWTVGAPIPRNPQSTGGTFCQCYAAHSASGQTAFLKALDFRYAFNHSASVTEVLERITALFNFEKELLEECERRNMDRVVRAIGSGTANTNPLDPFALVPYLIFESADADIRVHLDNASSPPSLTWKLRSIHHVATGMKQLHGAGIAHQDLKPSNVLVFYTSRILSVSKVADLGRASRSGYPSPYDDDAWAGDRNYAPPEALYSFVDPDWAKRRIAGDLYMLGGLVSFLFTQTTSIAALLHELPLQFWPGNWAGTFDDVLLYLLNAFSTSVDRFAESLPPKLQDDLVPVFQQLCHPNPKMRGFPGVAVNKNSLERYLSKFDLIASRAASGRYE